MVPLTRLFLCWRVLVCLLAVTSTRRVSVREGGGYEGKETFVYLKWAFHFCISVQNIYFSPRGKFFWFWVGGGGLPDPPTPVD